MEAYIKKLYNRKGFKNFNKFLTEYNKLNDFEPDGNVYQNNNYISEECHFIMRMATQYYLTKAFKAMKINMNNRNVTEDLEEGNISTPGRIAKVWCGGHLNDDTELGGGRWSKPIRIASFQNTNKINTAITKKVDLISSCSHHFIPFHSMSEKSYVIISYMANRDLIGISKLQRLVGFVSQRFWLQEDLTKTLYTEISRIADTKSVYVGLFNIVHGCEQLRGAKSKNGSFTTEYYGGDYNNIELRKEIKNNV